MVNNKRNLSLDTLKYIAILLVITSHFIDRYNRDLFLYYKKFPYSLILHGLSGKMGVAIFGVISGMLAYKSGKKGRPFLRYAVKRYVFFAICCFVVDTIYYFMNVDGILYTSNFGLVIGQSILLGKLIYPTFWFIRPFFIGSLLSFAAGKLKLDFPWLLILSLILLCFEQPWLGVMLVGCACQSILEKEYPIFKNRLVKILIAVFIFVMIKRDSSDITYYIEGICSMCLVILISNSSHLSKLTSWNVSAYLGKITMSLLIDHYVCMYIIDDLFGHETIVASPIRILLIFVLWFIVIHAIAIVLNYVIQKLVSFANRLIDAVFDLTDDKFASLITGGGKS